MVTSQAISFAKFKISCRNCSLAEICLPRGLTMEEIEVLENIIENKPILHRGDKLFHRGERFKSLYAVKSGSLKAYSVSEDGEEQVLGFYMPGELLGLDGIGTEQHICTAVALETTSVCELPYGIMEEMCHQFPSLQKEIYGVMGREIAEDKALLLLLGKRTADERIASFLLSLSRRYKERGFSEREFNLSMPRQDIANYLGLATETVSRILGKFQEQGVITVNRRLVKIHDLERMKKMVEGCAN